MNIELKWLNILIIIENFFGFSRQFATWSIPVKLLYLIRILAELILALHTIQCMNNVNSVIQAILTNSLTFSLLLLSCYYSEKFVKFIGYINSSHIYNNADNVYRRRLTMLLKLGLCAWLGYSMAAFGLVLTYFINIDYQNGITYKTLFNRVLTNLRFHLEFAIQYCLLSIMSEHLQCITRSLKKEGTIDYFTTVISTDDAHGSKKNIEEWRRLYWNVFKSIKLFNKIYGVQIAMSCFAFITFYVSMFYAFVRDELRDFSPRLDWTVIAAIHSATLFSMVLLTMVARAAQNVQNNARNFTRGLQHILVRVCSLGENTVQEELKQLLRIVSSRPINITMYGILNVNMTLIPACVALIASYTIVVLQFNNIV